MGLCNDEGYWQGRLSSSALSTAVAVIALSMADDSSYNDLVADGINWLLANQNADGGWGDTIKSKSNISTTVLVWCAFAFDKNIYKRNSHGGSRCNYSLPGAVDKAERWLVKQAGDLSARALSQAVSERYGKDKTFAVPILSACAISGRFGNGSNSWKWVKQLPFEMSVVPHKWYSKLRLGVVSYALPALIAIGISRHSNKPVHNIVGRIIRNLTRSKALQKLQDIQPINGGFLEAVPLTGFVAMNLMAAGLQTNPVVKKGLNFIVNSVRSDGSWPIDTNLATWVSTLSVNALSNKINNQLVVDDKVPFRGDTPGLVRDMPKRQQERILDWLLAQQYKQVHPYTNTPPGGWGWNDLPGAVPDADDTAGALIAIKNLWVNSVKANTSSKSALSIDNGIAVDCGNGNDNGGYQGTVSMVRGDDDVIKAVQLGIEWLMGLQNKDGGIATFCAGWGKLEFDRSSCDLTAHALSAFNAWEDYVNISLQQKIKIASVKALKFLQNNQQADGSWLPLWFGNQYAPNNINAVYGTARVVVALCDLVLSASTSHDLLLCEPVSFKSVSCKYDEETVKVIVPMLNRGIEYLLVAQDKTGGWGGAIDTTYTRGVDSTTYVDVAVATSGGVNTNGAADSLHCSVEETALAVQALAKSYHCYHKISNFQQCCSRNSSFFGDSITAAISRGIAWLADKTDMGQCFNSSPIGFYFAKLWYFEEMYPLIFTVAALRELLAINRHEKI